MAQSPSSDIANANSYSDKIPLNDGNFMPIIGLGVYRMKPGNETTASVLAALKAGYRMIDTSQTYENEADVAEAIRASGIPREEIFIQSKLGQEWHGYETAYWQIINSISKMGLDYLDCFLINTPYGEMLQDTYDALVQLRKEGHVKSIGVANFGVKHLELFEESCLPTPAVNQIEMHPYIYQERTTLLEYCKSKGILVQAYGSLFGGSEKALSDKRLKAVCELYPDKTAQQILLRWALQKGCQVIPKSVQEQRMLDNLDIFDFQLSDSDMATLSNWSPKYCQKIVGYWNPMDDSWGHR